MTHPPPPRTPSSPQPWTSRLDRLFGAFLLLALMAGGLTAFWNPQARQLPETASWQDGSWTRAFERHFNRELLIHDPAAQAWNSLRFDLFQEAHPAVLVGQDGWLFLAEDLRTELRGTGQTRAHLQEIQTVRDQLRAADTRLVVVLVPAKATTYEDHLGHYVLPRSVKTRYGSSWQGISDLGIPVVNLPPVFARARSAGDVFLRTDLHWTPHGAAQAAQATARLVRDTFPDLAFPTTRFASRTLPPRPFEGNLVRYLPNSRGRRGLTVGPEPFVGAITTSAATSSTGLLGEASVPVALVGTSFSADPQWNFAGFLKEALQTQVLNAGVPGKSPFEAMTRYLQSSEFETQPPQLLVWEIPERYLSASASLPTPQ